MRPSQQRLSPILLPMILLSVLIINLYWSSSNSFQIIMMGQNSCAKVGTCQYLVYNMDACMRTITVLQAGK
jgi:hypothetical protein